MIDPTQELQVWQSAEIAQYDIEGSLEQVTNNLRAIKKFVRKHMKKGVDYGTIPGAGEKPTLLKPGGEKLNALFNVRPVFTFLTTKEDLETGLVFYRIQCDLVQRQSGLLMGSGVGICSSYEGKYRWRWAPRHAVPPELNPDKLKQQGGRVSEFAFAIEKAETAGQYGKPAEYWARFAAAIADSTAAKVQRKTRKGAMMDAWEIDGTLYRIPNEDLADVWNTVVKIGQKRAMVAADLSLGCVSDIFTQDLEDFGDEPSGGVSVVHTKETFMAVIRTDLTEYIRDGKPDMAAIAEILKPKKLWPYTPEKHDEMLAALTAAVRP